MTQIKIFRPIILSLMIFLSLQVAGSEKPLEVEAVLKAEGRSSGWVKNIEKIREHLDKLNYADPNVIKFLPSIKRRCEVLLKLDNIGSFEKAIFSEYFEVILEDLLAGNKVMSRYAGQTLNYGYWSDHVNMLTGTKIQVPPDYDSTKEYQMFMYYKLGGGLYWYTPAKKYANPSDEGAKVSPPYQPTAEMCQNTPETFHAWSALYYGVKGRQGVVNELQELTEAMSKDFSISLERIFLSGYSDGGFTSMWLATHYPHLVAGIAPGVANWQYTNTEMINFFNFATLVVDGWGDGGYIQENLSRFMILDNMGYDVDAIIGHHGHKTSWLEDVDTVKKIDSWAKTKRRDPNPKEIKYATWNLAWNRVFWFEIERIEDPSFAAIVEAKIDEKNTIHITSKNIAAFQVTLNDKLVDATKDITMINNGNKCYEGPYKEIIVIDEKKDGQNVIYKSPERHGGIGVHATHSAYFNEKLNYKKFKLEDYPWSWVGFSGGEDFEAASTVFNVPKWATLDTKVSDGMIKNYNLIVYGGPLRNKFAEKIKDQLPVKFEKGKFTIGSKVYDEPQHWVEFLYPNPLNPDKDVLIFACNDPVIAKEKAGFGKINLSPWTFRDGDCVVHGIKTARNSYGIDSSDYEQEVIIFDANWQVPDQKPIGHADKHFTWQDILRLKAHAIKEKMGVDIGIYDGQPSYIQWKKSFAKGPLSVNDIITTHQFPEFIMTCELTGKQIKNLILPNESGNSRVKYHTLTEGIEDGTKNTDNAIKISELEDDKIYKVASGYALCDSGTLGLQYVNSKMPKPYFYFSNLDEYVKQDGASISCQKLIQSNMEVSEAVIEYIKKRKNISPQTISGSINDYILNPNSHSFDKYSWMHVDLSGEMTNHKSNKNKMLKGVCSIGLKGVADENKKFINDKVLFEVNVNSSKGVLEGSFHELPIKINSSLHEYVICGQFDDLPSIELRKEGEDAIGRLFVLKLQLTNTGEQELVGTQLLNDAKMNAINQTLWMEKVKNKEAPYMCGYLDEFGDKNKPTQISGLMLLDQKSFSLQKKVLPSGFNFGLIAGSREIKLKPKDTISLPIVFLTWWPDKKYDYSKKHQEMISMVSEKLAKILEEK